MGQRYSRLGWAVAILGLAMSSEAFAVGQASGPAMADRPAPTTYAAPLPAPPPPPELPPAPRLARLEMLSPPVSFCSEAARSEYLTQVFNPTVDASNANVAKANAHLDELTRTISSTTDTQTILAGHQAFDAYQPIATAAYHFSLQVLTMRPTIMGIPVVDCAPPPPPPAPVTSVAAAPPPPMPSRPAAYAPPRTPYPSQVAATPTGPKRTVAVGEIQASGGFDKNDNWQAGGALSAMLEQSLSAGGRVVVVERNDLRQVLNEAQLRATHVAGGDPTITVKMIPAQYLVVGSVTEFGSPNKGGGLSFGGANSNGWGGALSLKTDSGKISIDLRILDTRTAEVLKAFTVSKTVSHTGIGVVTNYNGMSFGGDQFSKTPLGEASRQAMIEAALHIADFVSQATWEAKVVELDGDVVFVNAGAEAGLKAGDRLMIERIGHTMTDPDTGQVLSQRREMLGELVIGETEAKIASGRFMAAGPGAIPQRGDLATLAAGAAP